MPSLAKKLRHQCKVKNHSINSFCGHSMYIETLWKVVKWSMKCPYSIQWDPIKMFVPDTPTFCDLKCSCVEPFSETFNIRWYWSIRKPLLPCTPLYLVINNNNKYILCFSIGTSNTHLDTHIFSYRTMKRVIDAFGCRMDLRNLPFDTHVCRIEIFSFVPVQQVFVRIFLNFTASQKTDQSSTQFF